MKAASISIALALGLSTVILLPSSTGAGHTEPAKGKKAQFALVNSFFRCDSPNTATQSNGTPACAPAGLADAFGCALSPSGSGKLTMARTGSATEGNQDIKLAVVAKGLNAACEGHTLEIVLSYRLTTDDCPEGSCTTVDVVNAITGAWCLVTNGKCKIKTTLSTGNPGLIATNNKNAGVEILGCGLERLLGGLFPTITCGMVLP